MTIAQAERKTIYPLLGKEAGIGMKRFLGPVSTVLGKYGTVGEIGRQLRKGEVAVVRSTDPENDFCVLSSEGDLEITLQRREGHEFVQVPVTRVSRAKNLYVLHLDQATRHGLVFRPAGKCGYGGVPVRDSLDVPRSPNYDSVVRGQSFG